MHGPQFTRGRIRPGRVIHSRASRGGRMTQPRVRSQAGVVTISTEAIAAALAADPIPYLDADWISAGAVRSNDGQRVELVLGFYLGDRHSATLEHLRGLCAQAAGHEVAVSLTTEIGTHAVQRGLRPLPRIHNILAVASGKGGVGKSSVTANLAVALAKEGLNVGVLDADVWGYSIPRMLGVEGKPVAFNNMVMPLQAHGVKVISIGFFVDSERPVIWRGPMLHRALQQFLADVHWGDLDFLLCDLPPGTGDIAISLAQMLPNADMLVVTTPQQAAQRVALRAGQMTAQTGMRVSGVIENMATFVAPDTGKEYRIFGEGGGQLLAAELDTELWGQIPIDTRLREGSDNGTPLVVADPDAPASQRFTEMAKRLAKTKTSLVGRSLPLKF